jgi:predicted oxidoreductase
MTAEDAIGLILDEDMKTIVLGNSPLVSSRLAYGCARIAGKEAETYADSRKAILAAYEAGYTLFDHADCYSQGRAETVFGQVLKEVPAVRDRVLLATKCGVCPADDPVAGMPYRYDSSAEYIVRCCEGSLARLGVERIDLYQIHRADYLMQPEEVADAFCRLHHSGKVREFGVSNFRPSHLAALQKACPMRLVVHQVEISLANRTTLDDGTLDQCLAEKMTPLAWSPLAGGLLGDGARRLLPFQEGYQTAAVVKAMDPIAKALGVGRTVVALAWLLKHPSGIVPIIGSTDPARIREAAAADTVELSREQWYQLLESALGERLP